MRHLYLKTGRKPVGLTALLFACNIAAQIACITIDDGTTETSSTQNKQTHKKQQIASEPFHVEDADEPTGKPLAAGELDVYSKYFDTDAVARHYDGRLTYDEFLWHSMRSYQSVVGVDMGRHRYERKADLLNSFTRNLSYADDLSSMRAHIDASERALLHDQSELIIIENENNQVACGEQLDALLSLVRGLTSTPQRQRAFAQSRELSLLDFLDSWGAPESRVMSGNTKWLGSYEQCVHAQLKLPGITKPKQARTATRYCVAHMRSPMWPQREAHEAPGAHAIKLGVCLPERCNTISLLRHKHRIEALIRLVRLDRPPWLDYKLADLFCLPDESSPMRQLTWSAKLFVAVVLGWLALVAYYTLKYEYLRMCNYHISNNRCESKLKARCSRPMRVFALRLGWRALFESTGNSSAPQISNSRLHNNLLVSLTNKQAKSPTAPKDLIDLRPLGGLKVLGMFWIIASHIVLVYGPHMLNFRDFWSLTRTATFAFWIAGIYSVETFLVIGGILTAYLRFSKPNCVMNCASWLEAYLHRYVRFMPLYLLMFWYERDVAEYMGHGPMWDYRTGEHNYMSECKRESFWVPLTFTANFKPWWQHCVKPAYYVANDYQFFVLAPLFMVLIYKCRRLGYAFAIATIIASFLAYFWSLFSWPNLDYNVIINVKPKFVSTVLVELWQAYEWPIYRIPPYIIGILTGHSMYRAATGCSQANSKMPGETSDINLQINEATKTNTANKHSSRTSGQDSITSRSWLEAHVNAINEYICFKIWLPILVAASIIYSPLITSAVKLDGLNAKIASSSALGLTRIIWSVAMARLIYICTTRACCKTTSFATTSVPPRVELPEVASSVLTFNTQKTQEALSSLRLAQTYISSTQQYHKPHIDSIIIRFLSSAKWKPWSKLGLSVLFVQWSVISYIIDIQAGPPNFNVLFTIIMVIVTIILTYFFSLIIYLTFEHPMSKIEQLYLNPLLFGKKTTRTS